MPFAIGQPSFEAAAPYNTNIVHRNVKIGLTVAIAVSLVAVALGVLALEAIGGVHVGIFHGLGSMGSISAWILISGGGAAISINLILHGRKVAVSLLALPLRPVLQKHDQVIEEGFKAFNQELNGPRKASKKFIMIPREEDGIILVLKQTPHGKSITCIPNKEKAAHKLQGQLGDEGYVMRSVNDNMLINGRQVIVADYTNHGGKK